MGKPPTKPAQEPRAKPETHRYTPRNTVFRAKAKAKFLEEFKRLQHVGQAAALARVDRTTLGAWRKKDPEFDKAWEDICETFTDRIEASALRWAGHGSERLSYDGQGRVIRRETVVYPGLVQFMLSKRRSTNYGEQSLERRIQELETKLAELKQAQPENISQEITETKEEGT